MTLFESHRGRDVSERNTAWLKCHVIDCDGRITHMYLSSDSRRTRMSRILSILKSSPSMSSTVTDESAMEMMSSCPERHRIKPTQGPVYSDSTSLESLYISSPGHFLTFLRSAPWHSIKSAHGSNEKPQEAGCLAAICDTIQQGSSALNHDVYA